MQFILQLKDIMIFGNWGKLCEIQKWSKQGLPDEIRPLDFIYLTLEQVKDIEMVDYLIDKLKESIK